MSYEQTRFREIRVEDEFRRGDNSRQYGPVNKPGSTDTCMHPL